MSEANRRWARLGVALSASAALLLGGTGAAWAGGEGGGGGGEPPPPSDPNDPQQPTSGLSDTETSYTGAVMLRGGKEVTMQSVVPGYVGDESYQADGRYAYFAGNTLYAGVQDDENNYVDLIAEFFWFESSIDRGSDFYVAVVKARTSPNLSKWVLERQTNSFLGYFLPDNEATLYLRAQTDVSQGEGFRWDWSIPFDNYGWDAYGNITMATKYGISGNAEGSAQKAIEGEVGGVPVEANVQAKGFLNTDYQVQTRYEVTLWRWEVVVHGSAGQIDWQMNLHNSDREHQNAYHEFFVVMQAEQGVPFKLDWLEVGGSVRDPVPLWFDNHRSLSAAVTGIVLRPPEWPAPSEGGENSGDGPPLPGGTKDDGGSGSSSGAPPGGSGGPGAAPVNNYYGGCALAAPAPAAPVWWALGLAGLAALALGRRRGSGSRR